MNKDINCDAIKDTIRLYKEYIYNPNLKEEDAKYDNIIFLLAISGIKFHTKYYDAAKSDLVDHTIPASSYITDLGYTNRLLNIVQIYAADKLQPFMPTLLGEDNSVNAISGIEFENKSETIKDHILNILIILLDKWKMDPSGNYNDYDVIDDVDTFITVSKSIMQCINDKETTGRKYYPKSCMDYIRMYCKINNDTYIIDDSMLENIANHYNL